MGKEINLNNGQPNTNVNVNPDDLTDVFCNECGNQTFAPAFLFKKLSAVLSPNGKASMVPLQIFKCDKCNNINEEFIPNNKDGNKML